MPLANQYHKELQAEADALAARVAELEAALAELVAAQEMSTTGSYDYDWPSKTNLDPVSGQGRCDKHGIFYSSCCSCQHEHANLQAKADYDARWERDRAMRDAADKVRELLEADND